MLAGHPHLRPTQSARQRSSPICPWTSPVLRHPTASRPSEIYRCRDNPIGFTEFVLRNLAAADGLRLDGHRFAKWTFDLPFDKAPFQRGPRSTPRVHQRGRVLESGEDARIFVAAAAAVVYWTPSGHTRGDLVRLRTRAREPDGRSARRAISSTSLEHTRPVYQDLLSSAPPAGRCPGPRPPGKLRASSPAYGEGAVVSSPSPYGSALYDTWPGDAWKEIGGQSL